jgi:hypothetical protein
MTDQSSGMRSGSKRQFTRTSHLTLLMIHLVTPNHSCNTKQLQYNSNYLEAGYPDQLGSSGNFVENSTKLICLEITSYRTEYSTVKSYGCLELQIRRGRKISTQLHTVNSNSRRGSHIKQEIPKL